MGTIHPPSFATARTALTAGRSGRVETISVSYPEGDQGREDEIIERILAHHGAQGRWIDSAELPLLGDVSLDAARRDASRLPRCTTASFAVLRAAAAMLALEWR